MVHAFVMVKTAVGKSENLLAKVREEPHVVEAHIVAGEYDIIAEVKVDEVYQVLEAASSGIQSLSGVNDTKTYISLG